MKKLIFLALAGLLALAGGCTLPDKDTEGEDYFVFHNVKFARTPVSCYMGNIEGEVPEGFSVPTRAQMEVLIDYPWKYYGHYGDTKGMLISQQPIDGFVQVLVRESDHQVVEGDFNRYSFTDDHLSGGVFLPVNDGWDGYYWSKYDNGLYTYFFFSMIEMKTNSVPNGSPGRILSIKGGMLPVKN